MGNTLEFAANYLQTWLDATENEVLHMPSAWHNAHQWTVAHMANVLYPLAAKLGYGENNYGITMQQEYYRVDFSLYTYYKQSTWTLDYAIEHENAEFSLYADESVNKKGWFDEFAKLLPLKCTKSRVIIGYDTFGEQFAVKLKKCKDLLNEPLIQKSVAESPVLLIIFPYSKYIKSKNYGNGLLHIIEFVKTDKAWVMNELTEKICDEQIKERMKNVYSKIAATPK